MRKIYKYQLDPVPFVQQKIPDFPEAGSSLLHFDIQNEVPTLWFEVDDETPKIESSDDTYVLAWTGFSIIDDFGTYLATALDHESGLVWHLYVIYA